MSTYKELLAQRDDLDKRLVELRKTETSAAIQQIKALISEFKLTEADIFSLPSKKNKSFIGPGTVAPKYRNPATNETWTGRGKAPLWIRDGDREQFRIAETA